MRYNSIEEVISACYRHLESNLLKGTRWGFEYQFCKPSQTKYGPYQWLWDSGFHQIIWSYKRPDYSIKDLRTMLQMQQTNGFIPEMIYWGMKSKIEELFVRTQYSVKSFAGYKGMMFTDITQMPMLAYSVRAIWNATNNIELLKEFVPKIGKYLEWWHNSRDPDKDGLVSVIHPWESGIDASPLYDPAHNVFDYPVRYRDIYPNFIKILFSYKKMKWNMESIFQKNRFNFEDVGVCSIYADGWNVLAKLADRFDVNLANTYRKFGKDYSDKIISKCWSDDLKRFVSYYHQGNEEKKSIKETIQSLFPLLLDDLPKDIATQVVSNLKNPEKFWLPYPIPSCAKSEPGFDPLDSRLLWRGPTWGSTNWLVMEGLIKHGFQDVAKEILEKWLEMYQKYGISEYHNPFTGEMEGQEGIGMSCLIVDMLYRLNLAPKKEIT